MGISKKNQLTPSRYISIHSWIKYHYGKANHCSNQSCTFLNPKRYEYALKKGKEYEKKIDNYIPLCVSCHRKYDFTEQKRQRIGISKLGNHNRVKPVIAMKNEKEHSFPSLRIAGQKLKISEKAISNALNGLAKKSGGYEWRYKIVV